MLLQVQKLSTIRHADQLNLVMVFTNVLFKDLEHQKHVFKQKNLAQIMTQEILA